jgi:hypothetical protein
MSEKSSAAGWVVQLTIPGLLKPQIEGSKWRPAVTSAPTFLFFNVAIDSPEKAIEAARKKAGAAEDAAMSTVRALSAAEIESIKLRSGDAKPA